jgi:hypothetical protein
MTQLFFHEILHFKNEEGAPPPTLPPAPFPFNLTPKHVGRDEDEEEKLVSLKKILPLL